MITGGVIVQLEAKPGNEDEVASFLRDAQAPRVIRRLLAGLSSAPPG